MRNGFATKFWNTAYTSLPAPVRGRYLAHLHAAERWELRLQAIIVFLGSRRADVEEIGEAEDLPEELQELGLPVLERVAKHLVRVARHFRRLAVRLRFLDEGLPAEVPVKEERPEEKAQGDPSVRIFPEH